MRELQQIHTVSQRWQRGRVSQLRNAYRLLKALYDQCRVASRKERSMSFEHENEVMWLDDRSKYRYLREVQLPISGQTRRPRSSIVAGTLVAYATLNPTAPAHSPGVYVR